MMAALAVVWRIAKISIPVPLALILAAALWVQFDKASAVRRAVNAAVKDLIAGGELAALAAERDAAQAMAEAMAENARRAGQAAAAAAKARDALDAALDAAEHINAELEGQINEMLATPAPVDCLADSPFLGRLRNN